MNTEESIDKKPLPILDSEEIRVLGSLMEKSKATPEYYPMTLNGLTAACNQKTSRNPVVNYDEQTVTLCLDKLKRRGLAATVTGGSSRVVKYKHNIALNYQLTPDELAVICLLFLRGPLTPGEINSSAGRLYEFDDLAEVLTVLEKLATAETPFVRQLERQPGQKEARYIHLFGDENMLETYATENVAASSAAQTNNNLEERLTAVEQELATLKADFDKLMKELMG
ncbi:YceH family protein [Niabella ginsengisoli]|uniref:YceH family protein n=1 Tax=Niabella ginsengisoli TaxID=522298 RepID=A0ABS9SMD9_9BACT|nr:YceH family protein [Niabella ginsengisoli]MCH5599523.1 YceH family protein [Niabella ginsengisoli]